jgi:hypothetical protein
MVRHFLAGRNAFNTPLERERRLLGFAGVQGTGPGNTPSSPAPAGTPHGAPNIEDIDPMQKIAEGHALSLKSAEEINAARESNTTKVKGVLNGNETNGEEGKQEHVEKTRAEIVLEKVKSVHKRMHDMQHKLDHRRHRVEDLVKKEPTLKPLLAKWIENQNLMTQFMHTMDAAEESAEFIEEWDHGHKSPKELLKWLEDIHGWKTDYKDMSNQQARLKILGEMNRAISSTHGATVDDIHTSTTPDISTHDKWETLGETNKRLVVDRITPLAKLEEKLTWIETTADSFNKSLDDAKMDAFFLAEEKAQTEIGNKERFATTKHAGHGMHFLSIYNLMGGAHEWWDAFKHAWHEKDHHKNALVAKGIGKMMSWIPFELGPETMLTLDQKVEGDNKKIRDEYEQFLASTGVGFKALFVNHHNELDHHKSDPNRALGVLQYAASRGWLYDLPEQTSLPTATVFGYRIFDLLPTDWDDQRKSDYVRGLYTKNQKGGEEETEKVKNREKIYATTEPFIEAMNREMKNLNFWGALGVVKAAVARAKEGEMTSLMATIIMDHLQNNEEVRQYISDPVLEQLGFDSFNKGNFTLASFTIDRGHLIKWIRTGNADNLEESGPLGSVIGKIKNTITERAGHKLSRDDMSLTVGKVLAAQVVKIPGTEKYISIFEPQFGEYRNNNPIFGTFDDFDVGKDQGDYWSQPSEVLLIPRKYVDEVLKVDSNGFFKHPVKAQYFLGHTINRHDELEKAGMTEALAKFKEEMREKIESPIKSAIDSTKWKNLPNAQASMGGNKELPAIKELLKRDIISESLLRRAGPDLLKQIEDPNYQPTKKGAPKAGSNDD